MDKMSYTKMHNISIYLLPIIFLFELKIRFEDNFTHVLHIC